MSGKHAKPGANNGPNPGPPGAREVTVPPQVVRKQDAAEEKKETRDRKRYRLEVAGLIAVIIYAGLTWWLALTSQRAVDQSASFFIQQTRPWVGLSTPIVITKISGGSTSQQMEFSTTIKNFGQFPAFYVIPDVELVVASRATNITPEINRICDHIEHDLLPIPIGVGEIVFPSQTYTFPTEVQPSRARRVDSDRIGSDPVYFFPGCILYKDTSGKVHHTGICQWTDSDGLQAGKELASCSRQNAD